MDDTLNKNTAPIDPLFDTDRLYAEDDEGNKIPDSDVEADARRTITLKFRVAGKNHLVEICPSQLTYAQRSAARHYAQSFAIENGVRDLDEETATEEELMEAARAQAKLETDFEYLKLRAEAACACVVRDGKGRPRVSIGHWLGNFSSEVVAKDEVFGRRFISEVEGEVNRFFYG